MRQPHFAGEFDLRFDQRLHLVLPAPLRRQIDPDIDGSALIVVTGRNRKPWLYPDRYYDTLAVEFTGLPESVHLDLALATRIVLDSTGCMLLPEKLVDRFCLMRDVTLIGVRDHLEIWNHSEWKHYRDQLVSHAGRLREA